MCDRPLKKVGQRVLRGPPGRITNPGRENFGESDQSWRGGKRYQNGGNNRERVNKLDRVERRASGGTA